MTWYRLSPEHRWHVAPAGERVPRSECGVRYNRTLEHREEPDDWLCLVCAGQLARRKTRDRSAVAFGQRFGALGRRP